MVTLRELPAFLAICLMAALHAACGDGNAGEDSGTGDVEDARDTEDAADTTDAADVADTTDAADVADTTDARDTEDVADTTDAADVTDATDAADTSDTADTTDVADVTDTAETTDSADTTDTADTTGSPVIGLDQRPANQSCVAPSRPQNDITVRASRVFSGFSFSQALGFVADPLVDEVYYVLTQDGVITRIDDRGDTATSSVFIDHTTEVLNYFEGGLLGMAFHPDYENNGYVFLSYMYGVSDWQNEDLNSRISRFEVNEAGTALLPNTETTFYEVDQPAGNHNGGDIKFGPDGMLYISLGDGGGGGDTYNNGQNPNTTLGALLRIDVDVPAAGEEYSVPEGNPFSDAPGADEIYAWGLRNVWRFSFDRETGDLWAADVGQNAWEEIDIIEEGGNYGWPIKEGLSCFDPPGCDRSDLLDPVHVYPHSQGSSITGGYVYRGSEIPSLYGAYIFGDYTNGNVWALRSVGETWASEFLFSTNGSLSSFGEDNNGELYIVDYNGALFRIVAESTGPGPDFPALLSETGCVDSGNPSVLSAGLVPYTVNVPFWSDGAQKDRYLAIPDGSTITVGSDGRLDFPNGTVLLKEFRLNGILFETRLLVRHADGDWAGYSYRWRGDGSDADYVEEGVEVEVEGQQWLFPSTQQCTTCHTRAAGGPLGPEVLQLNGDLSYPSTGRSANQLETLSAVGMIDTLPAPAAELDALPRPNETATDEEHARAWLHSNCSNCHRPGGTGRGTQDFLWTAADTNTCGVRAQFGSVGVTGDSLVNPGDADNSVLFARINHRGSEQMPPLATSIVDSDGVALVRAWIDGLSGCN